jgi:hypothetical protein
MTPAPAPLPREEIERLEKALQKATPVGWRAREIRYGAYAIEVELMCMNGLCAWFTVADVFARDDAEMLMSQGAVAEAGRDAGLIVSAVNALPALLAEVRAARERVSEWKSLLQRAIGYEPQLDGEVAAAVAEIEAGRAGAERVQIMTEALKRIAAHSYGLQGLLEDGEPPEVIARYFSNDSSRRQRLAKAALKGERPSPPPTDAEYQAALLKAHNQMLAEHVGDLESELRDAQSELAALRQAAQPATDTALRQAAEEARTNGRWTEGEQRGEWCIPKEVHDMLSEALVGAEIAAQLAVRVDWERAVMFALDELHDHFDMREFLEAVREGEDLSEWPEYATPPTAGAVDDGENGNG